MTAPHHPLHSRTEDLSSLFRPAPPQPGPSEIVPAEHLERGDAITILRCSASRGVYAVSRVLSMTALEGEVSLDVHPVAGQRRTVELKQFETITLWPGTLYRIGDSSVGDLLRMERESRSVFGAAEDSNAASRAPSSGYTIHSPILINIEQRISSVVPPAVCPGFELRLVCGFTDNTPHYHASFAEAYHVVDGEMRVQLANLAGNFTEQSVKAGETVVIPRYVVHHVVGGPEENRVLVAYWPRFLADQGDYHVVAPGQAHTRALDSGA